MAHDHSSHSHHHHLGSPLKPGSSATRNVKIAFLLNFAFTIVEFFGAIWTNSIAIWADVVHDFGDCLTLGLALLLQKLSERQANSQFTYGYTRFSLLSALIAGLVLCIGSVGVFYTSIPRFFEPQTPHTTGMILLAILGVLVNGAAFFRLRGGDTQNEKVLGWHLFEDFAGWAAVLIGAIIIHYTNAVWIDPLLACALAFFILWNAFKNLKSTVSLLLQRAPLQFDEKHFLEKLKSKKGICEVHDLHVWSLDGASSVMSLHVVLEPDINKIEDILAVKGAVREVAAHFGQFHVTIEIEQISEPCVLKHS